MANSAFRALAELALSSRETAQGLPAQETSAPRWSGVGFSLLGERFVSSMGHVSELLEVPDSTRMPGVQPWVIGLSNVRGRLLPLFDLSAFLGGTMVTSRKSQRVLVLETEALYSGIVVESSFGMQHFNSEQFNEKIYGLPETVGGFIDGAYKDITGETWPVFSLAKLAEDTKFINAALV
ncbi:MAG: chemotaxis protein CheW [Cellvibrionaceae bacterium]|nr:chemotaxis protein CheW [Cellvibrionaceae bacterium]